MTIKSNLNKIKQDNSLNYDSTFVSWWKYSQDKTIAFISLGAFWDFRNVKSDPDNEKFVSEVLNWFAKDIDKLFVGRGGHYLEHQDFKEKFWVANKYYAWRLEAVDNYSNLNLTIRQISKLDKILRKVEERDNTNSSPI